MPFFIHPPAPTTETTDSTNAMQHIWWQSLQLLTLHINIIISTVYYFHPRDTRLLSASSINWVRNSIPIPNRAAPFPTKLQPSIQPSSYNNIYPTIANDDKRRREKEKKELEVIFWIGLCVSLRSSYVPRYPRDDTLGHSTATTAKNLFLIPLWTIDIILVQWTINVANRPSRRFTAKGKKKW